MPTQSRCSLLYVPKASSPSLLSDLHHPLGPPSNVIPQPQRTSLGHPRRRRGHCALRTWGQQSRPHGTQPRRLPQQHLPLHSQSCLRLQPTSYHLNRRLNRGRAYRRRHRRRHGKHDTKLWKQSRPHAIVARS